MPAMTRTQARMVAMAQALEERSITPEPNEDTSNVQPGQAICDLSAPAPSTLAVAPQETTAAPEIDILPLSSTLPLPLNRSPSPAGDSDGVGSPDWEHVDLFNGNGPSPTFSGETLAEDGQGVLTSATTTLRPLQRPSPSESAIHHAPSPQTLEDAVILSTEEQVEGVPASALDVAISSIQNAATVDLVIKGSEALYYAAVDIAIQAVQRGDAPHTIPIEIPSRLLEACSTQLGGGVHPMPPSPVTALIPETPTPLGVSSDAVFVLTFIWVDDSLSESKIQISSPSMAEPTVQNTLKAIQEHAQINADLHREWRYIELAPAKFHVYATHKIFKHGQHPRPQDIRMLGQLDTLMGSSPSFSLAPIVGEGTTEVTEALGCGTYCIVDDGFGMEEPIWLPSASVFCLVIKEVASQQPPTQDRGPATLLMPRDHDTDVQTAPQDLENENRAFHHFGLHYAEISQRISTLRVQRQSNRPYFTRRLLELTDEIAQHEGLKQGASFAEPIAGDPILPFTSLVDWAGILRWATQQRTVNLESWRQKRSKLAFDDAYEAWTKAFASIRELVQNVFQLEPDIRRDLQNLESISNALEVLRFIKEGSKVQLPAHVGPECSQAEYHAMDIKWDTLMELRKQMKLLIPFSRAAEVLRQTILANGGYYTPPDMPKFLEDLQILVQACRNML